MNETDIKNILYYAGQLIVHVDVLSKYSRLGATEICRLVELEELISKIADICHNSLFNKENQNSAAAKRLVQIQSYLEITHAKDEAQIVREVIAALSFGENNS